MAAVASADRSGTDAIADVPLADRGGHHVRLPSPLTSFVGREPEVAAVCGLLRRDGVRLVTLTGPGGVGKTRLALRVAEALAPEFADGVAVIALAAVADPSLVAPTVALAFGVQEGSGRPVAGRLADVVGSRRVLLVLDNFEHLLAATPFAAGLLAACPGLTLLVTSRAVLRLSGEYVYPVPPLEVPAMGAPLAHAAEAEAVRLFAERAQAADPTFALTAENTPPVVAICARLEGLPLAVELAAAKIRLLPPPALLARLADRLPLLTGGPRDLPARQQTMRDTIAWSYDLLAPDVQALFRRLAVFAGGFTLEAATAVLAGSGDARGDAFAGIEALAEQSLVRRLDAATDETRFGMLETVREFGLERLAASGEADGLQAAHAAHFLTLAEEADPHLLMPGQEFWLSRLADDHDNLRSALAWLQETGRAEPSLRLAGALRWFWFVHGHYSEGRSYLEHALAMDDVNTTVVRARALSGLAVLLLRQGNARRAESLLAESLTLCLGSADLRETGIARLSLGATAMDRGDYEHATMHGEEALVLYRRLAQADPIAQAWVSNALNNLGFLAYAQGNLALATRRLEEALDLERRLGFTWNAGLTLGNLGRVAKARGAFGQAIELYRESLAMGSAHGDMRIIAHALGGIAGVATAANQLKQGARLFGAAEALYEAVGIRLEPSLRPEWEAGVAAVRAGLTPSAFAAAWTAGRAFPMAEVVAEAAAVRPPSSTSGTPGQAGTSTLDTGLTLRETEILRLLATGQTDREIAAALSISPRTANTHTASIYAKLGVDSRAEATSWALRHGLV